MVAKEAALKQMIEKVVERLEKKSFEVLKRERAECDELEALALDDEAPVRAQSGWRREVFGDAALRLKHGKIALAADGKRVRVIEL